MTPKRLLLLGASGDLAGRYLLPALAALEAAGKLPEGLEITGAARQGWDEAAFRGFAAKRLGEHASDVPEAVREQLVGSLTYLQLDLGQPEAMKGAVAAGGAGPLVVYMALPPSLFAVTLEAIGETELPPGSRVAIEKPFGEDLASARALNAQLEAAVGEGREEAVFRVDHVLGMATVHNLIGLRLANPVLEAVWNSAYIDQVSVRWDETLALEGRAGYFDRAGTLKDVLQNHALQVLSLLAMEPPASLAERDLRDAKVEALRSVRDLGGEPASRSRRARYGAGRIEGRVVRAYVDEPGVDPERQTETFAEIPLELDTDRWRGARFLVRGGKALGRRRKGVEVRFRGPGESPLGAGIGGMWIGIDGPNDLRLQLTGSAPGRPLRAAPITLQAPPPATELPPYARVLLDILAGDGALSVRGDEAEEAWRIVTPVLEAWDEGRVPLEEYPAGSDGPL